MQTMVPKSWRLCAIRLSACCAVLGFLPLRLVCATTVVIPKLFSTSYPSLLGRTHKPCLVITRISIRPSLTERDDELKVLLAQSRETDTILVKSQPNLNLITTRLLLPRLYFLSILLSGETC